ncbi:SAVMC3_10250 family protein [Streptomyces sp. NPDC001401]|uniref:SAVMC3_10250 family protein n=1 Tax=Streptomyces sp. NPDC001401 TaxID=3364570 RepID=UPI0036C62761
MLSELVYLSDAKLRQFLPLAGRRFGSLKAALKLTTPLVSMDVTSSTNSDQARMNQFRRVALQIERNAVWFAESRHLPGRWIYFEAPLNFMPLAEPFGHMVVFLDPGDPFDGYDPRHLSDVDPDSEGERQASGGRVRLLLHGSADHLLLETEHPLHEAPPAAETIMELPDVPDVPEARPARAVRTDRGPSGPAGYRAAVRGFNHRDYMGNVPRPDPRRMVVSVRREGGSEAADALETFGHQAIPVFPRPTPAADLSGVRHLHDGTAALIRWFDARTDRETAGWMRGYARVTADLLYAGEDTSVDAIARVVVASPLYVELAHDLP